jgi:DNA-binding NarL/FixJ family response regulator
MERPRIVVADDNCAFLEKLTSLLADDFEIMATASDGKSALELVRRCKPDLVVLDLGMPGLNGIEVTREIMTSALTDPPVVICSIETDSEVVESARQAGARGYVCKLRMHTDLILAIKSALKGKPFFVTNSASESKR